MFRDQQPAFAAHSLSGDSTDAAAFVHLSATFSEGRLATSGFSATPSAPAAIVAGISPGQDNAQRVDPVAVAGADGGDQAEHRASADRGGLPALAAALVFHGLIAAALLWHYSSDTTIKVEPPASKMVHATMVEDPAIAQAREQQRQQAEEAQRQAREQAAEQAREQQRAAEAQRQQRAEQQQRQANAERAREQAAEQAREQQRAAEAQRQQRAEQQQQRAAEQARAKAQADAKAAAQAKAKAAADAKAAAAQRAAESNTPETLSQTPSPTNRVSPVYPRLAQARNMQGSVTVRFTIRKDGSVDPGSISVVNSTNSMFEEAATDAVRKWQFKSRSRPGIVEQPVKFQLN